MAGGGGAVNGYRVRREPRSGTVRVRGLDLHVSHWGPPSAAAPASAPVFLLHGWQDTADTFQFMVDAFEHDWPLIAWDWRGFGRSGWAPDGYWFADYLADLEALLQRFSPDAPARLVGHSMGGNIAAIYAGVRPERVHCLVSLEGFGLPRTDAERAPRQLRTWLDQVKSTPPPKEYDSMAQLVTIIRARYPRFTAAQATFIAAAWSAPHAGGVRLRGDPRHRWANPVRYHREDAEACWRTLRAPILLVTGEHSGYRSALGADGSDAAFRQLMPQLEYAQVQDAGHLLQIDNPRATAALVERFLLSHPLAARAPGPRGSG